MLMLRVCGCVMFVSMLLIFWFFCMQVGEWLLNMFFMQLQSCIWLLKWQLVWVLVRVQVLIEQVLVLVVFEQQLFRQCIWVFRLRCLVMFQFGLKLRVQFGEWVNLLCLQLVLLDILLIWVCSMLVLVFSCRLLCRWQLRFSFMLQVWVFLVLMVYDCVIFGEIIIGMLYWVFLKFMKNRLLFSSRWLLSRLVWVNSLQFQMVFFLKQVQLWVVRLSDMLLGLQLWLIRLLMVQFGVVVKVREIFGRKVEKVFWQFSGCGVSIELLLCLM